MSVRSYLDGAVFAERRAGTGTGPATTLLAMHGWGRDRSDMVRFVGDRDALIPDMPGFGASPAPPEAWGAADYARAVAEMLEADGAAPYVVVGHSFGGRVGAALAAERTDLVAGVVFLGVPLVPLAPNGRPALTYRAARALHRWKILPEASMERMRQRYGSADYKAAQGVMRGVLVRVVAEDYSPYLRRIDAPVAFCWGLRDTTVPPEVATRAAAITPHVVDVDIVDGAGHDVMFDAPERARAAIDKVVAAAGHA
ncbi:MAG TPA: alpha/beta fold hydrolase [Acidimicrobiia bacterium]